MVVAFRYHLEIAENMVFDVYVSPRFGFYAFLIATCLSLVAGHMMVYFHRQSGLHTTDIPPPPIKSSLFDHRFTVQATGEHAQLSQRAQVAFLILFVLAAILLAEGMVQKSFQFEIGGLAGEMIGMSRSTGYSLLSIGASLRQSVEDPSSIGIIFLEWIYYFFAVITPFACLGLLMMLLVIPMTKTQQSFILMLTEMANAWSAIEVFVISAVATVLEIGTFSSFIIGDNCNVIDTILAKSFPEFDPTCYNVTSTVDRSVWYLVVGALVNSYMVSSGLAFANCAMREKIYELSGFHGDKIALRDDVTSLSWWRICGFSMILTPIPPPLPPPCAFNYEPNNQLSQDQPLL